LAAGHPVEHGTEAAASSKGTHGEAHEIEEPLPSPVFELPQEVGYGPAPTRPTAEIRRSGTGYTATHPSSRKICGTSFVFERFGPLGDTIGLSEPESCPKQVNTGNVTS
ncbi:MAG: hypothetical protein GY769_02755, partial [bacterium]|nr:hypothetical protein [bacterium]